MRRRSLNGTNMSPLRSLGPGWPMEVGLRCRRGKWFQPKKGREERDKGRSLPLLEGQ